MNPKKPSRAEIETRITALLLGELPAEEATLLRWTISQDAVLKKLHDELQATIVLVREAKKNPTDDTAELSASLKLSDERRQKLLAHFKTPRAKESFWIKPMKLPVPSLIPVLVVVAIVALLAAMLLPALSKAKSKSMRIAAINEAKQKALEAQIRADENPPITAPATPVPVPVTVAPQPVLAPPPAPGQIVLPPTKSPAYGANAASSPKEVTGGLYSQNIVGYVNTPISTGTSSTVIGGSLALQNHYGDGVVTLGDSPAAGVMTLNGGVGGGGGGGTAPSSITTWSLDDLGVNRSRAENKPPGTTSDQIILAAGAPAQPAPPPTDAARSIILPELAANDSMDEGLAAGKPTARRYGQGTEITKGASQLRNTPPASEGYKSSFSGKITPLPGRRAAVGEDLPALAAAPAPEKPQAPELDWNLGQSADRKPKSEGFTSFDGAVAAAMPTVLPASDADGVTYNFDTNGNLTQRADDAKKRDQADKMVAGNAGNLAVNTTKEPAVQLPVGGLRYLTITNGIATSDQTAIAVNEKVLRQAQTIVEREKNVEKDEARPKVSLPAPIPQPEILTRENAFSTFSLNVSDVSFKLAAASLEKGQMPEAASIRSEEFINAFDYRDPVAAAGQPLAFASERAQYPFAQNRDLLRFSIKTAAAGRPAGRALNLVLLLDNSGSMERADRVAIIREALRILAGQLQPQDTVSVVTFARTARLWADGVAGDKAGETLEKVGDITPEGGTNLEEAMRLAYETARRHYLANGMNRVVLLTDGAANLGNVDPAVLKQKVEDQRKQGIALDCFGIGFEDYDDDLLEQLSRNGDGRYAFINSPDEAGKEFATKLAGALQIAASDVKVQVEFNPQRVIAYRQIGYAKHQLTKEQFRNNTVDAAEIAAQEAGNALYTVEIKPDGTGPVATVHVRYKVPGTTDYRERSWDVAYEGNAVALDQSSTAMRLAGTASAFSEWLVASPYAQEVTPDELLKVLNGVPEIYGADERPKKLEWMIRQAKSLSGK